jgi:exodeoxyribonuclease V beta subunit
MKSLDLTGIPLEGTHLIEASAGTGKTYTIASLFIRLLLEKSLHVREILVVTYTDPATEELKTRVREKIRAALKAFETGQSDDVFLNDLLRTFERHDHAVQCLEFALRRFDEAAIHTIHGFCSRLLSDMAFESRSLFRSEMITDQADLLKQVAGDFYRMHFAHDMPPELVHYAINRKYSFDFFLKLVPRASLDAEVIPRMDKPDITWLLEEYRRSFLELQLLWPHAKSDVTHIFTHYPGFNRTSYKLDKVPVMMEDMETFLQSDGCYLPTFEGFDKFASSKLRMNKGFSPPVHVLFDVCERLCTAAEALTDCMERVLVWLKTELFRSMRTMLPARKDALGVMYYDDLLLKVHQALSSENRGLLRDLVSERYKTALIDEFQDTDPIQYGIFNTLFAGSTLFLIGDPKQAIYSFRGADIFTYLNAAGQVDPEARHTLDRNWRSEPALIDAINHVFHREHPFVYGQIAFEPVLPARVPDRKTLLDPGGAPLVIWFEEGKDGKGLNKTDAGVRISQAVAWEVYRLITGGQRNEVLIGGKGVVPRDIALIVREHKQGRLLKDVLMLCGIPCVIYSDENIFDTAEALEMEMLLRAVSEPGAADLIRTVLSGSLFGLDAARIEELSSDETKLEEWVEIFRSLHELWLSHGFMRMFRKLMNGYGVRPLLLEKPRGERMLTNFLHLAEILGEASLQSRLGMRGLITWLSRRRDPLARRDEKHQLRLESDEDAVKIITAHKSKGLEFPIVFCPFLWGSAELRDTENISFHDAMKGYRAFLDVGSDERDGHRFIAEQEELAEDMRLAYVAMTRARNRCYLVWGRFNRVESSALNYLFEQPPHHSRLDARAPLRIASPGEDSMRVTLERLCAGSGTNILVRDIPVRIPPRYESPAPRETRISFRELSRSIDLSWKVSSFTSLVSGAHAGGEADRDALYLAPAAAGVPDEKGRPDIFSFPRGARSGTMIHEIFEHLDFAWDDGEVEKLVARTLEGHGFDPSWLAVIAGMVRRVLQVVLGEFSLSGIRKEETLRELEFYLPVGRLSPEILREAFALHGQDTVPETFPQTMGALGFEESTGFLRGFIDLVFSWKGRYFLLDWKSNHLGNSLESYGHESLTAAMEKNHYILQAHIYSLALHHYLKKRVRGYSYEKNFGGVIYLFVRGVDPVMGPGYGVYQMTPNQGLMEHLSSRLVFPARDGEKGEGHGLAVG